MDEDPSYDIIVAPSTADHPVDAGALRRVIEATLARHTRQAARLSVAIVDDGCIAHLNQTYLGHRGPTDVLSFDLRDSEQDARVDGELILSYDTAARQARQRGHSIQAELMLYAVHGTLHLLGYDDREPADAERMHQVEDAILSDLGVGAVYTAGMG